MTADDLTRLRDEFNEVLAGHDLPNPESGTSSCWCGFGYKARIGDTLSSDDHRAHVASVLASSPTVAALIDRVERAERERDRLADQLAQCPRGIDGHACCDCPDPGIARALSLAEKWDKGESTAPPRPDETHADSVVRWYCGQELRAALLTEGADDGQ